MCCPGRESGVLPSPWVWGCGGQGGKCAVDTMELVGPRGQPRAGVSVNRPEPLSLCVQRPISRAWDAVLWCQVIEGAGRDKVRTVERILAFPIRWRFACSSGLCHL